MNNEEKIIAMLEKLNGTVENQGAMLERHSAMLEKQGEMLERHSAILEKQGEMLEKLNGTVERHSAMLEKQGEMLEKLNGTVEKHSAMLSKIQGDITGIKARLDYDVDVRLKAMAEGQDRIEERMDGMESTLDEVKALAEKTADRVDVIHAVVTQHNATITELKKVK